MINDRELDGAIVIGRMQLPHRSHLHLIRTALDKASKVLIVLGSAFHARTIKNSFTCEERESMIRLCLSPEQNERTYFAPVRDYHDDERWKRDIRDKAEGVFSKNDLVRVIGYFKDASSEYLSSLPWDVIDAGSLMEIDATALRTMLFESENVDITLEAMKPYVEMPVIKYLKAWANLPHLTYLREEHEKIKKERKTYGAPFGLTGDFVLSYTIDIHQEREEYVLLVRRGRMPGRGLYAIPGGFYEPEFNETLIQCAIREAFEETQHDIWHPQLMSSFVECKFFDDPKRSVRKNIMTMAHFFKMSGTELPHIRGSADPGESYPVWVKTSEIPKMEDQFFDDHFIILQSFLKFDIQ